MICGASPFDGQILLVRKLLFVGTDDRAVPGLAEGRAERFDAVEPEFDHGIALGSAGGDRRSRRGMRAVKHEVLHVFLQMAQELRDAEHERSMRPGKVLEEFLPAHSWSTIHGEHDLDHDPSL